jgi:O-antigen ligase
MFFWRGEGQTGVGPHNAFLQIYFEMGVAGLTSFLLLVAAIAFTLIYRSRADFAGSFVMLMMLVGYMVVFYADNLLDYLQFNGSFGLRSEAYAHRPDSPLTRRAPGLSSLDS